MIHIMLATLLLAGFGLEPSPEENRHLDQLVEQSIVYECDAIDSEEFANLVDASFIGVKVIHLYDKNCTMAAECEYTEHKVLKHGQTLVELMDPAELVPYLNPSFRLSSLDQAQEFEGLLDLLFPAFFSSGKEIIQAEDAWVFVREESFGEKNGVIVGVDEGGVILEITQVDDLGAEGPLAGNEEVER